MGAPSIRHHDPELFAAAVLAVSALAFGRQRVAFPIPYGSRAERERQRQLVLREARSVGLLVRTEARGVAGRMVVMAPKRAGQGAVADYLTRYQP